MIRTPGIRVVFLSPTIAFLFVLLWTRETQGAVILFFDGFENGLNGWQVGDSNPAGVPAYWGIVNSAFGGRGTHGGTNKLYCAAAGYIGAPESPSYVGGMKAFASHSLDLSGQTSATLSFWHTIPSIENNWDFAKVLIDGTEVWSLSTAQPEWTEVSISLDAYTGGIHTLTFQFSSDFATNYEGWYLDDILITDASIPGAPRTNDNFNAAEPLLGANGSISGNNLQATSEPGEPASGFSATNSVWFSWTTITNGPVTFSTEGSAFDTVLCIYSGTNLNSLALVTSDDNSGPNKTSRAVFDAVAGLPYRISVRGVNHAGGFVRLSWSQPNVIVSDLLPDLALWADPAQNYLYGWYLDRLQIPGRTLLRVSTATLNVGLGPLEMIGSSSAPEVYQRIFRNDGSSYDRYAGTFTFHPDHGHIHFENWLNFNLRSVLPGDGVGSIVVAGAKTSSAIIDLQDYDPDLPGHPAIPQYRGGLTQGLSVGWADVYGSDLQDQWIDVTGVVPGRYWLEEVVDPANLILESNESNNVARILIDLSLADLTGAPSNDNFANATVLTGITAGRFDSSRLATKESDSLEPDHAGNSGGASVWYRWVAPTDTSVTITTEGSDFDTLLAVYTGETLSNLVLVASNDNADVGITSSLVSFAAEAGTIYSVVVDGHDGASGNVQLNFNPAWNDDFNKSVVLTGAVGTVTGSNRGASRVPGEPLHAGLSGNHSVWYSWTAPADGLESFDTEGSNFKTALAIYTGSAIDELTLVGSDPGVGSANSSRITFSAIGNTTYRIAVDGLENESGLIQLHWQGPTAPSIIHQPLGTNLVQGSTLTLTATADGWLPLSYQWRHSGTNLIDEARVSGTLSPSLTIEGITATDAGPYTVTITNTYGTVTSATANLIVLDSPRAVYVEDLSAAAGGTVTVPVNVLAAGDEHAFSFSLLFDPAVLSHPRVKNGSDSSNTVFSIDAGNVSSGSLGLNLIFPVGQAIAAGHGRELARVLFDIAPDTTNATSTFIGFGDVPTPRSVASINGVMLSPVFAAGLLTLERAPVVGGLRLPDNRFQVSLNGISGRSYVLEVTGDLGSKTWFPVATNEASSTGTLHLIDPEAASPGPRFYHARLLPRTTE